MHQLYCYGWVLFSGLHIWSAGGTGRAREIIEAKQLALKSIYDTFMEQVAASEFSIWLRRGDGSRVRSLLVSRLLFTRRWRLGSLRAWRGRRLHQQQQQLSQQQR